MRPMIAILILSLACRCGPPALTCQTQNCNSGSRTYQTCVNVNGSVEYNFGGMSCTCSETDCQQCTSQVADYCNSGSGGSGGTGGSGGSGGGSAASCGATFSGAFTGTVSACAVSLTYDASSNKTAVVTSGGDITGNPYSWTGFAFSLAGMPATGTTMQMASLGASTSVTQNGTSNPPSWEAGYSMGNNYGSGALSLTALGPQTDLGGGNLMFQSPQGSLAATLVDQNAMTAMPDEMLNVTF